MTSRPIFSPVELPDFLPPALSAALSRGQRCVTALDGVQLVWHSWGQPESPTLVLLHGGSGSWTHWVRNITPLQAAGWRVLVPDLPGFGDSDLPPGCSDVPDLPAHLHAGLQQLAPQGPVQIVGFSFGGMTGALWLAEYPEDARALVLVGAPGLGLTVPERVPLKGWRHLPSAEAQDAVHRHNLMALMLKHPESLDALALDVHRANVQRDRMPRRRLSSTPIVAEALPRVQARVSAIYGEHDALYTYRLPEVREALARLVPNWGQWHTVPEAGHWVIYEAAAAFNAALLQVLGEA
ncbi:alpha/beta fold hydrolase [Limnohabitans radicicola]|uniref:Alpha/beta fold hydrolase n=1 Tax=Limnohabitans radicicola TaxID=2771427 RepID=A0A927IM97_9BURK|nr:alpha/beta hydrolase [Limnohabitans radicicola]MBD8050767.1 alpha/beta fold hydrolase [Limnohabitans radicicola]